MLYDCTVVWRSLLEDGAKLLEQCVPPGGDRGDVDQFVLHFGQQRTILLTDHPQPRRTRAVTVYAPRGIERDVHRQSRERDGGQDRGCELDTVAPEPEGQQVRRRADSEQARVAIFEYQDH